MNRLLVAALLVAAATWAVLPGTTLALVGWQLTASPHTLVLDQRQDVAMHLEVTSPLISVSCLRLSMPDEMDIKHADVESTSVDGEWEAKRDHSGGANTVTVFDKDKNAPLGDGDWVDFTLEVRPHDTGPSIWLATVLGDSRCRGLPLLTDIVLQFVVDDDPSTPAPTPTRSPDPTAQATPTPTPTRRPTSTPTLRPTSTPTLRPTSTPTLASTPTPAPNPTPSPHPTATTPAPTPVVSRPPTPKPTPTPTSQASPAITPAVSATERPTPSDTPGGSQVPVATLPGAPPAGPTAPDEPGAPQYRFEMPATLYSWQAPSDASASVTRDVVDTVVTVNQPVGWFIPALAAGVPGILIIGIVAVQLLLGVSWLPGLGRLLGPVPDRPDDDSHLWWANGRPMD